MEQSMQVNGRMVNIMGHKDNNMALDTYSAGLKIEPLVESINKLTYGEEVDSFVKDTLKNLN